MNDEKGSAAAEHSRGAHAPSHVVFDALVGNLFLLPVTPAFRERATLGRWIFGMLTQFVESLAKLL
jgi:hypothetical protein